jgi:hypothetical protein
MTFISRELEAPKGFVLEKHGTKRGKDGRRPVHTRVSSNRDPLREPRGEDNVVVMIATTMTTTIVALHSHWGMSSSSLLG